ncbi:vesicle-associated protein 2-2-like isoform X2 [Vigna unguiculata]|uniref:vesicle-associated protein 2-2-like isoform X2 n=1 Tax=Vigna unguiculata TaxID=3917 RepID=UPI001015ED93|nr:vesicle-associated protein 2-2-like isoform X2 [Vigna unguiculata]
MATDLLLIHPSDITFRFELKKQSSCVVRLANHASHHVAFKVKTTSPKKYCVRPTVGIVQPHGTCDFTVTMQAQRTAPPDFNCKDKFLVQSAVVPAGTTEDDISSDLFVKDSGRLVEEKKLRVVLIGPSSSPENGDFSQDPPIQMPSPITVEKSLEMAQGLEEDGTDKGTVVPRPVEKEGDMKQVNGNEKLSFPKDFKELESRLSIMDAKLREAEGTIAKLNEEKRRNTREKNLLKQELMMKKKMKIKRAQEGFPFLFVCVVSLVSMAVGYYIHA